MQILPFDRKLLENFEYNGVEKEISGNQIIPIIEYYASLGKCYIGFIENKVIGVAGIYPLWTGSGGAFLFLNREAHNHKIEIFKILLQYMHELINEYGIKTLIVSCLDDSLEAHNLIKHLGFIKGRETKMAIYIKQEN
jgi:RimJ/RimL family protein N-acetyltransferase